MSATAFFDITGGGGRAYIFEAGALRENFPFELSEEQRFHVRELPGDIEEAYLGVPLEMLDFRVLELPVSEPEKVREVLPFELEDLILGGAEGSVFDAVVFPAAPGEKHKVLAIYTGKEPLRTLLLRLGELGLDPRAVTNLELAGIVRKAREGGEVGSLIVEGPSPDEAERAALALSEIQAPTINLRRGELAFTRDMEWAKRSMRFAALALVALLLVFAGDVGLRTAKVKKEAAIVEGRILQSYLEMFPGEKPAGAQGLSFKARARMKEARDLDAFMRGVSPLGFLMKLQEKRQPSVVYSDITLDREFVVLKGEAPSLSDVEKARAVLEEFLTEVKISETGQSVKGGVSFTITARERES